MVLGIHFVLPCGAGVVAVLLCMKNQPVAVLLGSEVGPPGLGCPWLPSDVVSSPTPLLCFFVLSD